MPSKDWSDQEIKLLLEGVKSLGDRQWEMVSRLVGTKTKSQWSNKWRKEMIPILASKKLDWKWKDEQDSNLLNLALEVLYKHKDKMRNDFSSFPKEEFDSKFGQIIKSVREAFNWKENSEMNPNKIWNKSDERKNICTNIQDKQQLQMNNSTKPISLNKNLSKVKNSLVSNNLYWANMLSKHQFFNTALSVKDYKLWTKDLDKSLFILYIKNNGNFKKICECLQTTKLKEIEAHFFTTLRWIAYEYNKYLYENVKNLSAQDFTGNLSDEVCKYYISNPFAADKAELLKFIEIACKKLGINLNSINKKNRPSRINNENESHSQLTEQKNPYFVGSKRSETEKKRIRKENQKKLEILLEQKNQKPRVQVKSVSQLQNCVDNIFKENTQKKCQYGDLIQ